MDKPTTIAVKVARKALEATDICRLELVAAEGGALPAFSAGAHIDVHLPGGWVRPYSLCNSPADSSRYVLGILNDPQSRGGSRAVHTVVQEGDLLHISPPKNLFALNATAQRSLLLAGGIGITPLLSMAEHLQANAAEFQLHYCTRAAERTAFRDRIAASAFAQQVQYHFDDGDAAQKLDLTALLAQVQKDSHVYVCGPKGFMDVVLDAARACGWPQAQLHSEFFSGEVVHAETDAGFEVQIASTGQVIAIPKDKTVTQALSAAGVDILTSCEQGVCGTCLTRVLQGVPDHKDSYLLPEEQAANDQFMPCCSRAKSARLVLDL